MLNRLSSHLYFESLVCTCNRPCGQLFAIILWVLVLVGRLLVDCALLLPWLLAGYCTAVCIAAGYPFPNCAPATSPCSRVACFPMASPVSTSVMSSRPSTEVPGPLTTTPATAVTVSTSTLPSPGQQLDMLLNLPPERLRLLLQLAASQGPVSSDPVTSSPSSTVVPSSALLNGGILHGDGNSGELSTTGMVR